LPNIFIAPAIGFCVVSASIVWRYRVGLHDFITVFALTQNKSRSLSR